MRGGRRSLRSILLFWFLLFAIVPIGFITGFTLVKYEDATTDQMEERLEGNSREIFVIINDLTQYLLTYGKIHASDTNLVIDLASNSSVRIQKTLELWLKNYVASRISVFDESGKLLLATRKVSENKISTNFFDGDRDIYLSDDIINESNDKGQFVIQEARAGQSLEIVVYTKITSRRGLLAGYLEEMIVVDDAFLKNLNRRLKLEMFIVNADGGVSAASQESLKLYSADLFQSQIKKGNASFFDLSINDESFGFILSPLPNSQGKVFLGIGTSKKDIKGVLRSISIALLGITGVVVLLLIPTLLGLSKIILRPLDYLVMAAQRIEAGEPAPKAPAGATVEISALLDSFNKMSQKVLSARRDLENKVKELEVINRELQVTQAQLVHTSKMVGLGQLVAGIAHELNNPIGFIYSNMSHLKDYSERLVKLVEVAEASPDKLAQKKAELEFEYILEDMPKLIRSCEDGARRTRDIVVGLRNFSRLDEAKVKDTDIEGTIRNTLDLLAGEFRNRVDVHLDFESVKPIKCIASEINQVFMNILSNASHAISGKGTLHISTHQTEAGIEVLIEDSGAGISQENLEKIFDPFFTTKPVGQGTGLGLSISYGIIKKHGGEIEATSEPGVGTEFYIFLPFESEFTKSAPS